MAVLTLVLLLVYLTLTFGVRTAIQWRRTRRSGFVGVARTTGLAGSVGGILFALAIVLAVTAPVLATAGVAESLIDGAPGARLAIGFPVFVVWRAHDVRRADDDG